MIVKISPGGSFKALCAYLMHDPEAQTADRVAWSETRNCRFDDPLMATHEMYWTWRDADVLKAEAGVRKTGRKLEHPLKHVSLSWHPTEKPSRKEMIAAAETLLRRMGWGEHQAAIFCHNDKPHPHLHIMLNAVHPETGRKLDDRYEQYRSQEWALDYEREQGRIRCAERLLPREAREPSATRPAWNELHRAEEEALKAEARRMPDRDYMQREEDRKIINGSEWTILKTFQRQERIDFFAGGKEAYGAAAHESHRQVRRQFQQEWSRYYAAKRSGLDKASLRVMRGEISGRQKAVLQGHVAEAFYDLRQQRDRTYRAMLERHQEERRELHRRQDGGLSSPHLLDRVNRYPEIPVTDADMAKIMRDLKVTRLPGRRQGFRLAKGEITEPESNRYSPYRLAHQLAAESRRVLRDTIEQLGPRATGAESVADGETPARGREVLAAPSFAPDRGDEQGAARASEARRQQESRSKDEVERLLLSWSLRRDRDRGYFRD